jgi:hypothetical protein
LGLTLVTEYGNNKSIYKLRARPADWLAGWAPGVAGIDIAAGVGALGARERTLLSESQSANLGRMRVEGQAFRARRFDVTYAAVTAQVTRSSVRTCEDAQFGEKSCAISNQKES